MPELGRFKANLITTGSVGFITLPAGNILQKWGGLRDSNPQQPEPQSGALPLSYGHHFRVGRRASREAERADQTGLEL